MGWEEGKGEGKMLSILLLRCFLLGNLSCDVFKRRTSTLSGLATLLSRDFVEMFEQIVSIRAKKVSHTNRHGILKEKKAHFRLTCVAQKRGSL